MQILISLAIPAVWRCCAMKCSWRVMKYNSARSKTVAEPFQNAHARRGIPGLDTLLLMPDILPTSANETIAGRSEITILSLTMPLPSQLRQQKKLPNALRLTNIHELDRSAPLFFTFRGQKQEDIFLSIFQYFAFMTQLVLCK